jgi:Cft2 family RNA processing exonuclease
MIYSALGASDEIGASCHYLKLNGTGLLLDLGSDPEKEGEESVPNLDLLLDRTDWWVDHAFVTHAHHDHLGSVPVALRQFPHMLVHMTGATRQLADILLPASARLQRRKMREGTTLADPLFAEEDVEACSYLYMAHDLETWFDVTGVRSQAPIRASLYDAGHVLGACGVLIEGEEDGEPRRIFYTSDTGMRSQTIIPGASYPESPIDVLMLESTLGADPNSELSSRREEEKRLGEAIADAIKRGGSVLLPVFALGRGQEIIALLDRYKNRGVIPEDVPIYTAGLMRAISDIYDKTRFSTPRLDEGFQVYGVQQRRLPRSEAALSNALSETGIYVVGSGMMFERTISNRLAQRIVENKKNGLFLVGYARDDSPARRVLQAAIEGEGTEAVIDKARGAQPVNCAVDRFRFSGHSHRRDLIQLVEQLNPGKVILVHGETMAREWMRDNLQFFYPDLPVFSPEMGETLEI